MENVEVTILLAPSVFTYPFTVIHRHFEDFAVSKSVRNCGVYVERVAVRRSFQSMFSNRVECSMARRGLSKIPLGFGCPPLQEYPTLLVHARTCIKLCRV